MDIQKKPTLAEKQAFWAEQLPKFESKYWLPSHFEFLVFDMDQGNYVIKDGLDPTFDDDATEIWHRVNTGWAMWKKAINFTKAQAVPEGFVLVPKEPTEAMIQRGTKANSECLNENAPLGERLFRHPALQVYQAMVNGSGE